MASTAAIALYLNDLLKIDQIQDYCPNGLQIAGKNSVQKVVTAVTASQYVIEQAIKENADCLLVHHGYFWKNEDPRIIGIKYQRIANLIKRDMNLLAYHLPLDIHPELGNNVLLGELLECESIQPQMIQGLSGIVYLGHLTRAFNPEKLSHYLWQKIQRKPLHLNCARQAIQRLAWCTGAGQDFFQHAIELGVDAFISGEVSERTYHLAQEANVHYFACGHHATERLGICALGEHLVDQFEIEHKFIDEANPV